ncbi:MAG: DUF58 domain-containing protein [Verrucomicrobia bacterium]|nr:DUF58 domain-containing protein [Verrucomicrobiota bacterium]
MVSLLHRAPDVDDPGGQGDEAWSGPGGAARKERFTWSGLVWALVYPQRGHRILPTVPGVVLIALSFGIGTAAYNSSSNILFITLSLLLACLILSGVLSWLNLRGVRWRLRLAPPLRVGHDAIVALELRSRNRFVPTYGLWFEFAARPADAEPGLRAESTLTAKGAEVRAALAQAEAAELRGRVPLAGRLDPGGETRVEWVLRPERRGNLRIELVSVGSLFPFGFLRKDIGTGLTANAVVWPAPVEYRRHGVAAVRRLAGGERVARAGHGGDLLALRRYISGDSHRLIHWKASARTRTLLVRQFAAESAEGYAIWLLTDAGLWPKPEQFELLISFVATLSEDLFRGGQLRDVAINAEPPMPVRRVHDLEWWLNKLATVRPAEHADRIPGELTVARQNVMTFVPDGVRGVVAYVDGQKAASV